MMRPGNGFGSAERLVEGLAGRRSVDSIATGRRSHSQSRARPDTGDQAEGGHKILGSLPSRSLSYASGERWYTTQVKSCSGDGMIRMQEVHDPALVPAA